MTKLSEHFTLEEMSRSREAEEQNLDNTPPSYAVGALTQLCVNCLEPLRAHVGGPIHVHSGYRSLEVNRAVGGTGNSQHLLGEAADITASGMTAEELFLAAKEAIPVFDQLIQEFGIWVHISYSATKKNRKQVFRAIKTNGRTEYLRVS